MASGRERDEGKKAEEQIGSVTLLGGATGLSARLSVLVGCSHASLSSTRQAPMHNARSLRVKPFLLQSVGLFETRQRRVKGPGIGSGD